MGRWQPDALGRLMAAALELYDERGFEQTTVADIAARAGVTERTFFRHFGDKREVLFDRDNGLHHAVVEAVAAAPAPTTAEADPMTMCSPALDAACDFLADRREHARRRQRVIDAHPALQERELLKMATLTAALVAALRERDVPPVSAQVAAEMTVGAFRVAFARWIAPDETRGLRELGRATLAEMRAVLGAAPGV